jgi:hypothetical protein
MMTAEHEIGKVKSQLIGVVEQLCAFVANAARTGATQYDVERRIKNTVLDVGRHAMELFLHMQGNGDGGETLTTASGQVLQRSAAPVPRILHSIFGTHEFHQFVYAAGARQKIELRPLDARMSLPPGAYSYLVEKLAQLLALDASFLQTQKCWQAIFGQTPPVDSLERLNRRVGEQAGAFLEALPAVPPESEGELLVISADAKGVPLVQEAAAQVPAFEQRERPGNRRMATLGAIYSVNRHVRTAADVVAALFREDPGTPPAERPTPCGKHLIGRFSYVEGTGEQAVQVSGACATFGWLREQVAKRHRPGQPVVRLLDGQPSLLEAGRACFADGPEVQVVDVLDVIHVASYVWSAAKLLEKSREHREAFVATRLQRILEGDVHGVLAGIRQMATKRGLRGRARKELDGICSYLEKNAHRMRYDEYLAAGYPIATGVIEGACRHLVKDRLERSGMRWSLAGAQAMLNVRAVAASSCWNEFHQWRMAEETARLHPHAALLKYLTPHFTALC